MSEAAGEGDDERCRGLEHGSATGEGIRSEVAPYGDIWWVAWLRISREWLGTVDRTNWR